MNDDETNLYGWRMRLMQVEEDLFLLEKERDKCKLYIEGLKERIKEQNNSKVKEE